MKLATVARMTVFHRQLPWPWMSFDATATRFAFASSPDAIATRRLSEGEVLDGASFSLPEDLRLPDEGTPGLRAFSIASSGELLAAIDDGALSTLEAGGGAKRTTLDALGAEGFHARAVAFDRKGSRIWISAESATEQTLLLVDARTHERLADLRSKPFPQPAQHELFVHAQDDAVLLLAACGQDGTFARVAGFADGPPERIETALDDGGIPAGFVGFSADGARVHLVEADELRTHAWPSLHELSSVELEDDFVSMYAGVVLGDRIFVDGEDAESGDEGVMQFDRSAIRGVRLDEPVPTGMWAGRLGADGLVTIDAKGDPAEARVVRLPAPAS